jgi:hypothetical protein
LQTTSRQFLLVFLTALLLFFPNTNAFAANENLFAHQNTTIPEKQNVENIIVMGGDVTVYGTVRDAVVIFNGNLTVKKSARIQGIVLVIGGSIHQEPGAQVTDNILSLAFDSATKNSLFIAGIALFGFWLARMAFSLVLLVLPVLTAYVMKQRIEPFARLLYRSPIQLLTVGFIISLSVVALSILLSITIIGIPFVVLMLLLIILIFIVGLAAMSMIVGEWLPGNAGKSAEIKAFTGTGVIIACVNLPFFGSLLLLCLLWISLGMMAMWIREKMDKKKQAL